MIRPRPTMTQKDRDELRAYFGSPEGRRVLDQINRAYYSRLQAQAREEAPFWRDIDGNRIETEAASTEPLDPLRTFPAPTPQPVARLVSLRRSMIVTWISCAVGLGAWLVWLVIDTIRRYA